MSAIGGRVMTHGLEDSRNTDETPPQYFDDNARRVVDSFIAGLHIHRSAVVYVSTPITTGMNFYAPLASAYPGSPMSAPLEKLRALRERAMEKNAVEAQRTLLHAQSQNLGALYVNPTHLVVPGWSQSEYLDFWTCFVRDRVGTVVLAPGWEYSTGSVTECSVAFAAGLRVTTDSIDEVTRATAVAMVDAAIARLDQMAIRPAPLLAAAADLSD